MSEYDIVYTIEHGVSSGLGSKSDDTTTDRRTFNANNDLAALKDAATEAERLAESYMTNTNGEVKVGFTMTQKGSSDLFDLRSIMETHLESQPGYNQKKVTSILDTLFPRPAYCEVKDTLLDRIKEERL